KPATIEIKTIEKIEADITVDQAVGKTENIPNDHYTIFRFENPLNLIPQVKADGTEWNLFLSKQSANLASEFSLSAVVAPSQPAYLFIPLAEKAPPLTLTDPEIGDTLIIVPVY